MLYTDTYPKKFTTRYFRDKSDARYPSNEWYITEELVNNKDEERDYYEGLDHEANLVIEIEHLTIPIRSKFDNNLNN